MGCNTLPDPYGLPATKSQQVNEMLSSKVKTDTMRCLLSSLKDMEISNLSILNQNITNTHKFGYTIQTIANNQKELKEKLDLILESLLQNDGTMRMHSTIKNDIEKALATSESICTKLKQLSSDQQIQRSYLDQIKKDIEFAEIFKWLLQFIQANILMSETNYEEAYKIFNVITNPKNCGFNGVKMILKSLEYTELLVNIQLSLPEIYKNLPEKLVEQCELSKLEACIKAGIEGKRFTKINSIISSYLEESLIVMKMAIEDKNNMPKEFFKILLENLSEKTTISVLSHIGGELISLGHYEEAIECLNLAIKQFPIQDRLLQLDIIYNIALAQLHLKQYEQVFKITTNTSEPLNNAVLSSRYSDIMYLKGVMHQALEQEEEAFTCFSKAIEHANSNSISLQPNSQLTKELLTELVTKNKIDLVDKLLQKFPNLSTHETLPQIESFNQEYDDTEIKKRTEAGDIEFLQKLNNQQLEFRDFTTAETLLHIAASEGHLEAVKLLYQKGCSLYDHDNSYYLPIHYAAAENRTEVVEWFLEQSEEKLINKKGDYSYTPLHMAAENDSLDVMIDLIKHGAKVKSRDQGSRTPLDIFLNNHEEYLNDYFRDYNWKGNDTNSLIEILTKISKNHKKLGLS